MPTMVADHLARVVERFREAPLSKPYLSSTESQVSKMRLKEFLLLAAQAREAKSQK